MTLKIVHTQAEGTLIEGTSKGDGTAAVLRAQRWRWGPSIGSWYIPRSRDHLSKDWEINATKAALEAAGFEVEVQIDNATTRSVQEREADLAERNNSRAGMYQDRATRQGAIAAGAAAAADLISGAIPMGQPILVGHHSERRHRRELDRMHNLHEKSWEATKAAQEAQRRADDLSRANDLRQTPHAVASRIERIETELRSVNRRIEGSTHTFAGGYTEVTPPATGEHLERLTIRKGVLDQDLEYWQGIRAEQIEAGAPVYSAETIGKGDWVQVSGLWYPVIRVNPKSVTVQVEMGGKGTAPYHKITGHKTAAEIAAAKAVKAAKAASESEDPT